MAKVTRFTDKTTGQAEDITALLKKFKKAVANEGTLMEAKRHRYFRSKSLKRMEKAIEAKKRLKSKKRK